ADLPGAFTVSAGGQGHLETHLILPDPVGRHALATIYVEYANTGNVAMPAPLLVLVASDHALMTLDQSLVAHGLWTTAVPDGFRDPSQFLASGAPPGVLQPGERVRVPIYYAGLRPPWNFSDSSVNFNLEILDTDPANTDSTRPIDWAGLEEQTRPPGISAAAW